MATLIARNSNRLAYTGRLLAADRDFYGTPPEWVEAARKAMGGIELDPASCQQANDAVVHAERFFDEADDALQQSWAASTVFLNPPYGKTLKRFAEKFCEQWSMEDIKQAVILINNTTDTSSFDLFARCSSAQAQTRGRIQFVSVDGRSRTSNTRGQVFFYCGPRVKKFARVFKAMNCRVLGNM